jgi:hypothetical protein
MIDNIVFSLGVSVIAYLLTESPIVCAFFFAYTLFSLKK